MTRAKLTTADINNRINQRGITIVGEYTGISIKTEFRCSVGHVWKVSPNDVVSGNGCPHCSGKLPLTVEKINERLRNRGISIIGEYKNTSTKTEFQCADGHRWMTTPNSVLGGCGCSQCTFDYTKPAMVYVLSISDNDKIFTGFGITNNTDIRFAEHRSYLKKSNKYIIKNYIFNLTSRFHAIDIEKYLKKTLPIFDSGITGFITEATRLQFDDVTRLTEDYILHKGYNEGHN